MTVRTTLLAAAVVAAVALVVPATAAAGHWWFWSSGSSAVVHLNEGHAPNILLYNNAGGGSAGAVEHARSDWSIGSPAMTITNQVGAGWDLHLTDGWWGATGWRGLTSPRCPCNSAQGHVATMDIQLNLSYLRDYWNQRKTACHELGHATAGVNHGGTGCMMTGTPTQSSHHYPAAHDIEHTNVLWLQLH